MKAEADAKAKVEKEKKVAEKKAVADQAAKAKAAKFAKAEADVAKRKAMKKVNDEAIAAKAAAAAAAKKGTSSPSKAKVVKEMLPETTEHQLEFGRIYNFKEKRLVPYEEVRLSRADGAKIGLKFGEAIQGAGIRIKSVTAGGQADGTGKIKGNNIIAEINSIDVRRTTFDLFKKELLSKDEVVLKIIGGE